MKGIFVVLDGLGDLPHKRLEGQTPLEAAKTPHLDFLATRGELGYMYPVKPGYSPGSDESILSIFGNDLKSSSRGEIEAWGSGLSPGKGDLVLRVNFGTIDSLLSGNVLDRRAGRTLSSAEAEELGKSINEIEFPHDFEFLPTIQHRAVLIIKGDFSEKIVGDDITYTKGHSEEITKIVPCKALVKDKKAEHTAYVLNEFLRVSHEVLKDHPVNRKRIRKGLMPANYLLVRGPGVERPKLKQYRKWVSANYMPLEIGFSKLSGMKNFGFDYPPLKKIDVYGNLWKGLRKASKNSIKVLKKNLKKYDYAYIHFKETDLPGHDNKPFEKKMMIEYLDKSFFKYISRVAPMKKIKVVVAGDHSTPCKLKSHSADPVPVLFYNGSVPKERRLFNEKECRTGTLGRVIGKDLFRRTFLK